MRERLKQFQINPRKNSRDSNGIRTRDLCDTDAMLYQLSYEASLEAVQVRVQIIPIIWREWHDVYMIKIIWVHFHFYSLSTLHSHGLYYIHTKQNTMQNRSKRNMLGVRLLDIKYN